ncbi:DUF4124 domain-containing protein [Hydrogenophaga sp. OTU3427]|uniref:DUF4124 domain-containing protein n=1 Tax=Hydrogenophaga sp. OTU3427 TaxID=3043856 RepID=UPI00313F1A2A
MKPIFPLSPCLSRPLGLCLLAAAAMAAGAASAQWQWKDPSGRPVFSDQPPPPSVADKDILKRPGERAAPATAAADAPKATGATENTTPPAATNKPVSPAVADSQLEEKKKQLEKAEADKRKAESKAAEEKEAKARAANCEAARRNKASLDSGARLTVPNAKGETEYLDEAGRATQRRRAEEVMRENCR